MGVMIRYQQTFGHIYGFLKLLCQSMMYWWKNRILAQAWLLFFHPFLKIQLPLHHTGFPKPQHMLFHLFSCVVSSPFNVRTLWSHIVALVSMCSQIITVKCHAITSIIEVLYFNIPVMSDSPLNEVLSKQGKQDEESCFI